MQRKKENKNLTDKQIKFFDNMRKLSDVQVKAIKVFYATGRYSMRDLGAKFGVSRQTILAIVHERLRYSK